MGFFGDLLSKKDDVVNTVTAKLSEDIDICNICKIELVDKFIIEKGRKKYVTNVGSMVGKRTICCCCNFHPYMQKRRKNKCTKKCDILKCPNKGSEMWEKRSTPDMY